MTSSDGPTGSGAMTVRFWGVRGSIACPGPSASRYGGNTPCVEVRCGGHTLIFDAGTGIRQLGNALLNACLMPQGRGAPVMLYASCGPEAARWTITRAN